MAWRQHAPEGQTSVTHRPRWTVIGRVLVRQWAVVQFLLLPPFLAALLDGEWALAAALGGAAAITSPAILLSRRVAVPDDIRRVEAVLTIVAAFALAILLTAPAYMALGLGWIDAVFEATSALTTTGFSMVSEPEAVPLSGHILRAWSMWCGGLVIAVAGIAFLMDRGPVAKSLGLADFGDKALVSSVRVHARALLLAYLAITGLGVAGAVLLVPGLTEGPLLALAAVSTGGMAPRGDSLASYSGAAQTFLILLGFLGALSLAFPVLVYRKGLRQAARSSALTVFLIGIGISLVVAIALHLASGVTEPAQIGAGLLNLLSVQSTTGFSVAPIEGPPPVLVLFIALMAVGGQTGSTAGGMKVERVRILFAAVVFTLRRFLSPSGAVLFLKVDEKVASAERILFAVALVTVYALSAFLLWIAFVLHGLPPAESLFDTISALSTVGAGVGVIGPDMPEGLKLLTALAMLLGRLEFFGLIILALPRTWKRRD